MLEVEVFDIPEHCIPIRTDVRVFDFDALAKEGFFLRSLLLLLHPLLSSLIPVSSSQYNLM